MTKINNNQTLEDFLLKSEVPTADINLTDRIIAASYKIEQRQTIWQFILAIFAEFKIPNPVYSFLSLLVLGFVFSFFMQSADEANLMAQLFYQYEGLL